MIPEALMNPVKFNTEEAEALRFYDYPNNALEEAVVNAFFINHIVMIHRKKQEFYR